MKNIFYTSILLVCSYNQSIFALESNFCDSTTGLEQLTEYINCSGSTKLAACGALGGVAAGRVIGYKLAAKKELESLVNANKNTPLSLEEKFKLAVYERKFDDNKRYSYKPSTYEDFIKSIRNAISRDGINKTEDFVLKNLVPPVDPKNFTPRIAPSLELIDGKVYDLMQFDFKEVPRNSKFFMKMAEHNKFLTDAILDQIAAKKDLDSPQFVRQVAEKLRADFISKYGWKASGLVGGDLSSRELEVRNAVADFKAVQKRELLKAPVKAVGKLIPNIAKMGSKAWMISGGIFGMGLGVATEAILPTKTACSTSSDFYKNVDEDCNPVYELNQNVLNFLDKDPAEQARILKSDKSVCEYYKQLHAKAFQKVSFASLECKSESMVAEVKGSENQVFRYIIKLDSSSNPYKVSVKQENTSTNNITFNIDPNGDVASYNRNSGVTIPIDTKKDWTQQTSEHLNKVKLFLPEMQECCKTKDDSCKKDFGLTSPSAGEGRSSLTEDKAVK